MLLHALAALRLHGFRIEHTDDAVGVAHGRDFGVGDDDSLVGIAHREHRAPLDSRRTVAENPVKFGSQFGDNAPDPVVRQGILVPGLGCWKQPQILQLLVANESLRELCNALHDIDEVEYNPSFRSQYKVEVAQADVEVDDDHSFSHLRESRTERGCGSRLSDAAFARRHDHNFSHSYLPPLPISSAA